jgi:hypothetical protein
LKSAKTQLRDAGLSIQKPGEGLVAEYGRVEMCETEGAFLEYPSEGMTELPMALCDRERNEASHPLERSVQQTVDCESYDVATAEVHLETADQGGVHFILAERF